MNDDDLIELALASGFWRGMTTDRYPDVEDGTLICRVDGLRAFWQEAVRLEREAIAAMCQATQHEYYDAGGSLLLNTPQRLAAAIRARSEVIDDSASPIN